MSEACTPVSSDQIEIIWEENQAVGISLPLARIDASGKSLSDALQVRIKSNAPMKMLGNIEEVGSRVTFRPLVPLTRGLSYEVLVDEKVIETITVPVADRAQALNLQIFPSQDTVPENLLKIYLKFSRPMQEGRALEYLALLDQNGDTLQSTFLDLKPELWNADRDMLTVWLDPGRIKRGLHPNKELGQPLTSGRQYTLVISPDWKDVDGIALQNVYRKVFAVTGRDSLSPRPNEWIIHAPVAKTTDQLCVQFREAIDYGLLDAGLHVLSPSGSFVAGRWISGIEETSACFAPESTWTEGNYSLEIETRMEDLSGNNVNRAFEVDASSAAITTDSEVVVTRKFAINLSPR